MSLFARGLLIGSLGSLILVALLALPAMRRLGAVRRRLHRWIFGIRAIHLRRIQRLQNSVLRAQRLAEVGTLTGGLAHEIKNPLSTVQLNLQLLAEDLDPAIPGYSRLTNRLNTVQRETSRLRDILDDFLKFAGKIELARQTVDLNILLEELADFFAPQAQLQRVKLRLKLHPNPLMAQLDPRLIKQAVLNLMLNALQAMPEGGELILVASAAGSEALIDIIDTGAGIPPDALEKIFQAYYSTKKGGTGLGLAMTRRIIEEHGGRISITSQPGKGSDFQIHLPLADLPASSAPSPARAS